MIYYIGFRHGWVRLFGHTFGWSDPKVYPTMSGRRWFAWNVWFK